MRARSEKFFTLSFPERQGKGDAALPALLRPFGTPTKFSGSGAICGVCTVRDDLPTFPSTAAGWYKGHMPIDNRDWCTL